MSSFAVVQGQMVVYEMKNGKLEITIQEARRLFLLKQHLVSPFPKGTFENRLLTLLRDTAYIQWDPVSVVAPSHLISMWSRIGVFNRKELDTLLFKTKIIFLHYAPIAFLVLTEDYPIYYSLMKDFPHSFGRAWNSHISSAEKFISSHEELRKQVLEKLSEGEKGIGDFRYMGKRKRSPDGWTSGNEVSTLLTYLHMQGEIMVSGRSGAQNLWSLSGDFLPDWTPFEEYSQRDLEVRTALRSFNAIGVATEMDINRYFVRGRYWSLPDTLKFLESGGNIQKVDVEGGGNRKVYYIAREDVSLLDKLDSVDWESNMRILAPFDNILNVRDRTERFFNFKYTLEQFFPKDKRKYGTYVLPVLWQDKLVARMDAKLEKESKTLKIVSVHSEPGFENDARIPANLSSKITEFAQFLSADRIEYSSRMPDSWSHYLKNEVLS